VSKIRAALNAALLAAATLAAAPPAAAQGIRSLPVTANDLAYSPLTGRLYASVAATSSITEIDPVSGTVGVSFVVGSQPNKLAVSGAGDYLFVGLDGLPGVVRVHLPSRTVGTPFPLGTPDPTWGARSAEEIVVLPGSSDTIAVARRFTTVSPHHAGVAIYDGGVERTTATAVHTGSNVITLGATPGRLYGFNIESTEAGFRRMDVTPSGVTVADVTTTLLPSSVTDIDVLGGRLVASSGQIVDPESLLVLGTISGLPPGQHLVEPTPATIYVVTSPFGDCRLKGYDATSLAATFDTDLPSVTGQPHSLIAAGTDRIALANGAEVLLVTPSQAPQAPGITITGPTASATLTAESSSITLTGTAGDPNGSALTVTWTNDWGYSGTAAGGASWTAGDIPLIHGGNHITVTVTDDTGLTATDHLIVTVPSFSSLLAEGATGEFFDYDLALANPSLSTVDADITYLTPAGGIVTQTVTLPAESRRTIKVDEVPGLAQTAMSTIVRTATVPIVVERTMRWGQQGVPQYGAHGDKATAGAALKWYFAEGAHGFFYTYLLLANPNDTANTATIDWLIEGGSPVQSVVNLPPQSRTTIDPGAEPALINRTFGIVVTFAAPAAAERAMYFGTPPEPLFKAGHDSAGVTAPATRWFFAEGATGPFFETFILLANPNLTPVDATLRFLTQGGGVVQRTISIPAQARRSIDIEGLSPAAPELANVAVATIVDATQPIIAERAQYWPGIGQEWYEAHNAFGVTGAHRKWALAEGRVGNPPSVPAAGYQTYILLANPGTTAANVTMLFLRESGAAVHKTFTVQPESRFTIAVAGPGSQVPELANEMFGTTILSSQPIVVERALYGNAGTQVLATGTNATGTVVP
jgi:hypothetical protein